MNKLTAIIITKNEEDKMEICLNSLSTFVDEIVVVDDCSKDDTVEICKKYGAKIIIHESKGNFDRQRNLGIENASCEWILQIDADEIIPEDTAKKIIEAINNPGKFVAFELKRKNFLFGHPLKYGGAYNYGVKLFKKRNGYYLGRSVHETLKIDGDIGKIDADIYHYPFSSISEILNKTNFYTDVESKLFVEEIDSISFKEIKYRLTWKSLKLFWKLYFKKKGYKDGMYGLVWCILNVIGPQIRWLKIWEKAIKEGKLER
jgi:glycosyltransferase involved in cell wall biosynthesis